MAYKMRAYQGEDDYWRIRQFLREVFVLNGRRQKSWDVVRFDYWRWHINENLVGFKLEEALYLWETTNGQLAAVLQPDMQGEVFLQKHPALGPLELEEEMLAVAEDRFAAPAENGRRQLRAWADERDAFRQELLRQRGYQKGDWAECQRRR